MLTPASNRAGNGANADDSGAESHDVPLFPCYMTGAMLPFADLPAHHAAVEPQYHRALDHFAANPLCGMIARSAGPPLPDLGAAESHEQAEAWLTWYRRECYHVLAQATILCKGCQRRYFQRDIGAHFGHCQREAAGAAGSPLVVRFSPQRQRRDAEEQEPAVGELGSSAHSSAAVLQMADPPPADPTPYLEAAKEPVRLPRPPPPPPPEPVREAWTAWLQPGDAAPAAVRVSLFLAGQRNSTATALRWHPTGSAAREWRAADDAPAAAPSDLDVAALRLVAAVAPFTAPAGVAAKDPATDLVVLGAAGPDGEARLLRFDTGAERDAWVSELAPLVATVDAAADVGSPPPPALAARVTLFAGVEDAEGVARWATVEQPADSPLEVREAEGAESVLSTVALRSARLVARPTRRMQRAVTAEDEQSASEASTCVLLASPASDDAAAAPATGADEADKPAAESGEAPVEDASTSEPAAAAPAPWTVTLLRFDTADTRATWLAELRLRVAECVDDAPDLEVLPPADPPADDDPPPAASSRDVDDDDGPRFISGFMEKFAIGKSSTGARNWKRRWFELGPEAGAALTYREKRGKKVLGTVPVGDAGARLVRHPTRATHGEAREGAGTDVVVVFREGSKEYKLLLRCDDAAEHERWTAELAKRIGSIDSPEDSPFTQRKATQREPDDDDDEELLPEDDEPSHADRDGDAVPVENAPGAAPDDDHVPVDQENDGGDDGARKPTAPPAETSEPRAVTPPSPHPVDDAAVDPTTTTPKADNERDCDAPPAPVTDTVQQELRSVEEPHYAPSEPFADDHRHDETKGREVVPDSPNDPPTPASTSEEKAPDDDAHAEKDVPPQARTEVAEAAPSDARRDTDSANDPKHHQTPVDKDGRRAMVAAPRDVDKSPSVTDEADGDVVPSDVVRRPPAEASAEPFSSDAAEVTIADVSIADDDDGDGAAVADGPTGTKSGATGGGGAAVITPSPGSEEDDDHGDVVPVSASASQHFASPNDVDVSMETRAELLETLAQNPTNAEALLELALDVDPGETLLVQGVGAIDRRQLLYRAIAADPMNGDAYFELAAELEPEETIRGVPGLPATAEADACALLRKAIELKPDHSDAHLHLALQLEGGETVTLPGLGESTDRDLLIRSIELDTENSDAIFELGNDIEPTEAVTIPGFGRMGKRALLLRAVELDPGNPDACSSLADTLRPSETVSIAGAPVGRRELYARTADLDPGNKAALVDLADCLRPNEFVQLSAFGTTPVDRRNLLVNAIALEPTDCTLLLKLSYYLNDGGAETKVRVRGLRGAVGSHELLLRVIELEPGWGHGYSTLADRLGPDEVVTVPQHGQLDRRKLYTLAVTVEPTNVAAHISLAESLSPGETVTVPSISPSPVTDRDVLLRAAELDNDSAAALFLLARRLDRGERIDVPGLGRAGLRRLLTHVIKLAPGMSSAYRYLAGQLNRGESVVLPKPIGKASAKQLLEMADKLDGGPAQADSTVANDSRS